MTGDATPGTQRRCGGRRVGADEPSALSARPLITIATVTFNAAHCLPKAIESVATQRYLGVEHVIVDGGSTDGTVEILQALSTCIDYWVSEPDDGVYDAMNKALSLASGDWILFLGADDVLFDVLDDVVPRLLDKNAVYYGNVRLKSSRASYLGRFSRYKLMQSNIPHQAIFYPRSAYSTRRYDPTYRALADHKYNIELWASAGPFVYLPLDIALFDDEGLSSRGDAVFDRDRLEIIKANFGRRYFWLKKARNILAFIYWKLRGSARVPG